MQDFLNDQFASITVCDIHGIVIYQNERSIGTFSDVRGKSLFDCHPPHVADRIRRMFQSDVSNAYTIEKKGKKKMIYQTPWKDADGAIAGLVEYSFEIPFDMPHYVRDV